LKFLIDECLHFSLAGFAQVQGHEAYHVTWLGLAGTPDWKLIARIIDQDFTFVTNDARDFSKLYAGIALHAGLIILVPQVPPQQQVMLFDAALRTVAGPAHPPVNEVIEVRLTEGRARISRQPLSSALD
jgi:predicted nuclease of predicted toxin-antitoxin system